jgi:hypothetical protein
VCSEDALPNSPAAVRKLLERLRGEMYRAAAELRIEDWSSVSSNGPEPAE